MIQHDGGGDRSETLAALPHEIDTLRGAGYRFVTVTAAAGSIPRLPLAQRAFVESVSMSQLPANVRIREVGPRDGFQNEPEVIPTAEKVRLIELLGRTGLRRIEVTSFVRADVIPQLADAEQVLGGRSCSRTRSRSAC